MREQRKFIRVPVNLQILYKTLSKTEFGNSFTKDISQGGVRFFVSEFIPKGSILKLRILLRRGMLFIEASAKVRWIKEKVGTGRYEAGVEFFNVSEESMEYLINYISNNLKYNK